MKFSKLTLTIIGLLFLCFTLTAAAKAEGSRSYIAPGGSDNRQCSRSQPCRTFDGALAKTDEGGEIIALETSTYDPTTITKSMTLTAAPGADVVIRSTSSTAVTVHGLSAATVVLRGLKISGPGKNTNSVGVSLTQGGSGTTLLIENCVISDFGTGISAVNSDSARLGITNSTVRNNNSGVITRFQGSDAMGAFATGTRFERNEVGFTNFGGIAVVVKECVAAANTIGFLTDEGGAFVISNSLITRNSSGIDVRSGQAVLSSSVLSGNVTGIEAEGIVTSKGDNIFFGNSIDKSTVTPIQVLTTL